MDSELNWLSDKDDITVNAVAVFRMSWVLLEYHYIYIHRNKV